jgi:hypothetical protein
LFEFPEPVLEEADDGRDSEEWREEEDSAPAELFGWMMKNPGGMFGSWEQRWFHMQDGILAYFSGVNDQLKGGMTLKGCKVEVLGLKEIKVTSTSPRRNAVVRFDGGTFKDRDTITLRFGTEGAKPLERRPSFIARASVVEYPLEHDVNYWIHALTAHIDALQ